MENGFPTLVATFAVVVQRDVDGEPCASNLAKTSSNRSRASRTGSLSTNHVVPPNNSGQAPAGNLNPAGAATHLLIGMERLTRKQLEGWYSR
jgi:hypothetical protein